MMSEAIKLEIEQNRAATLKIISFSYWLLSQCINCRDTPFYIDEYLHAKVDEWYHSGDPK